MNMKIHDYIRLSLKKLGIPIGDVNAVPIIFTKDYVPKDSPESEKIPAGTVAYLFQYFGGYGEHYMNNNLNPDFFIAGVVADEGELVYNAPGFVLKCTLNSATETVTVDDINIFDLVTVLKEDSPIYIGAMDYWDTSHALRNNKPTDSVILIGLACVSLLFCGINCILYCGMGNSIGKLILFLISFIYLLLSGFSLYVVIRRNIDYRRAKLNAERLPFLVRRLKESGRKFIANRGEVV